MQQTLLISFVVPAFNAQSTLSGCVRSIVRTMSSCRSSYEILIVDDGSTDNTPHLAQSLADEIAEVRILTQENRGLGAARNTGIDQAKGRYIAFVDADDEIESASPADFSLLNGSFDIIAIPIFRVNAKGKTTVYGSTTQRIPFGNRYAEAKDYLLHRNVIPCVCAYLWRRETLTTRFTEGIYHEDEEFTVLALLKGETLLCTDQLFVYRYICRSNSITTSPENKARRLADFAKIIARLEALSDSQPTLKRYLRTKLLWLHIDYFRQRLNHLLR